MSRKQDTKAFKVGLFAMVAIAIAVCTVLALGAGSLGQDRIRIETYFAESVHGLSVGSPVKLRGVQIGSVEEVSFTRIEYPTDPLDVHSLEWSKRVLVVAALKPEAFPESHSRSIEGLIEEQIGQGLRLQLALEGISGLLFIEANYWPGLVDEIPEPPWISKHHYVPAQSSAITQVSAALSGIFSKVDAIDVEGIAGGVQDLLASANSLLGGLDTAALQADTTALLSDLRTSTKLLRGFLEHADQSGLIGRADSTLDDVSGLIASADKGLDETLADMRLLIGRIDALLVGDQVNSLLTNLQTSSGQLPTVLARADRSLSRLDLVIGDQGNEFTELLRNLNSVSSKLDHLLSDLRGHPSRALFGNPPPPSRPYDR